MTNITEFQIEEKDGSIVDWVKIDRGNDEFTWMPKSVYDAQMEHLTEIIPSEAKTK